MGHKTGMIYGVIANAQFFDQLARELTPDLELIHFVDGGLPSMAMNAPRPRVIERLRILASFAQESGAEAILLTPTPFGRLVDDVKSAVTCPVLSVLETITDEALKLHGTIGILANHAGTLTVTSRMLHDQASIDGKSIRVQTRLCAGAFDALLRFDWTTHNRIVHACLRDLMAQVDVVIVPEAPIEKAMREFPENDRSVPVLTSARLSLLRLKAIFGAA